MSYTVTREDILSLRADAAVLCVENKMVVAESAVCVRLAEAGGEALRAALRRKKFLPVGSADALGEDVRPLPRLILVATPHWNNAQSNELLILRYCYRDVFRVAEEMGCRSVVMPFLSAYYYRFPREDAVHAGLAEAEKCGLRVTFAAEDQELLELSRRPYRKAEIREYIGYYRDDAIFSLDNGQYIRVDIRPEKNDVAKIIYFEPYYRLEHDPKQTPLTTQEIDRLKSLYYSCDW